jgi:hypothetical protein
MNMSTGSSSPVVFDLLSERGIIDLLAVIRASSLSIPEKRMLRDLVLSYAQSKGDKNLYKELNEKITTFKLSRDILIKSNDISSESSITSRDDATTTNTINQKSRSGFSSGRSMPVFSRTIPVAQSSNHSYQSTPAVSKSNDPISVVPHIPVTTPPAETIVPIHTSEPVNPAAAPSSHTTPQSQVFSPHIQSHTVEIPQVATSVPATPQTSQSAPETHMRAEVQSPTTEAPQVITVKSSAASSENVPSKVTVVVGSQNDISSPLTPSPAAPDANLVATTSLPTVDTSANQYLLRIQEIKSDINQKIGNPVNLVDIDNAVGREYMSALLDAMKSLSSGGDISNAMRRLETAYIAALRVVDNSPSSQKPVAPLPSAISTTLPVTSPAPVPQSSTVSVTPVTTPVPIISAPSVVSASSANNTPVIDPVVPVSTVINTSASVPAASNVQNDIRITPIIPNLQATVTPTIPAGVVQNTAPVFRAPVTIPSAPSVVQDTAQTTSTDFQSPATQPQSSVISSVADAPPLKNISELPLANEVQTASVGTNPLFTKEIDDGLDQLLAEWPLFSRSGLFGRGPNRREHPLFIQLSNMPIPLILTGRFEGATPQVMQSISDYMNGWRYEQGLVYDADESFEHFLRRVIRHIINWQRKKNIA